MSLQVGCPRCPGLVTGSGGAWSCVDHGDVRPVWSSGEASYDDFSEHLLAAGPFPTYLPWPMLPEWQVTAFARAGGRSDDAPGGRSEETVATMTCSTGPSLQDGPVDVFVVTEEPGTGLGSRVARYPHVDPGSEVGVGPPTARILLDTRQVPLWAVTPPVADPEVDRSVLAGEASGRWLWVVVRPASAVLMLVDGWLLRDTAGLGAVLLEVPFGGHAPRW